MTDINDPLLPPTEEQRKQVIRQRNLVLALMLGGLVVLFFAITVVKFGH